MENKTTKLASSFCIVTLLWSVLAISILKNCQSEQWDNIFYGCRYPQNLNNLIYFLGIDIILLLWGIIAYKTFNNIISWMLMMFGIGKVFDEFLAPYGYHTAEMFYDMIIFIWAICKYFLKQRKLKQAHG